jgi:hypothetical protein
VSSKTIWCIGLYASASTWLFNALRQTAAIAHKGNVKTHFFSGTGNFAGFDAPGALNIVKSHEIRDDATVAELARRSDKIFVTLRDPRDAVTSLMLYHGYNFTRALDYVNDAARLCVRFSADPRTLMMTYESEFFDESATMAKIAAHAGLNIPPAEATKIFNGLKREAVEKYIAGLPKMPGILQDRVSGDRLDPKTHWHTHHSGRSGEIGRWRRQLTPDQVSEVEQRLADCFGFKTTAG